MIEKTLSANNAGVLDRPSSTRTMNSYVVSASTLWTVPDMIPVAESRLIPVGNVADSEIMSLNVVVPPSNVVGLSGSSKMAVLSLELTML